MDGALLHAIDFAARKHTNQRRKDSAATPYINHPIGVAWILYNEGSVRDVAVLQAAVLHDTVEDTDTTFDELRAEFGPVVEGIVREVTDDKSLEKQERKRMQIEHAAHASNEARLVKLADKIYNLRDLQREMPQGWTAERVQEYFAWAKRVTDHCRVANAALAAVLDDIYARGPVRA